MNVIKRDKTMVPFQEEKIRIAINKANAEVPVDERVSDDIINGIILEVKERDCIEVEEIQDMIEVKLMQENKCVLAKAYMLYRYTRQLVREQNTTDESIMSLIRHEKDGVFYENSNKNANWASTQRDLIAGEVSKDLTTRMLLPKNIVKAHETGAIHFHDMDYFIQQIFNCCLINIKDMLDNGTIMNGKMIETPKSFQVACTVMTQIITSVASGQYGGQSVNIKHLGKYLRYTREKYKKNIEQTCPDLKEDQVDALVKERSKAELESGVQTIQYQLNTIMTSNGQTPFVTLFLHIDDDDEYKEEVAEIIMEIFRQRIEGIKNEKGVAVTVTFPKLVYVLDTNNNLSGGKYDYVTKLAIKCSAKRMYPDYISAKKMRETYEGNIFSPMGCVDNREIVTYRYDKQVYQETIGSMWDRMVKLFDPRHQNPNIKTGAYMYIDTPNVEIYDTKEGFVKNLRIIRNLEKDWRIVKFDNGKMIDVTYNHPFEVVGKGVVQAKDLMIGDIMVYESRPDDDLDVIGQFTHVKVQSITAYEEFKYSYDVTTSSEHFEVSGLYSHNCRSFLSPWKNEKGEYVFEGRFNMGVVSLNLPQIAILANKDMKKFWEIFEERLELCKEALLCRYKALKGITSDISPVHWQGGSIARLEKGEKIDSYLEGGYSTISLGYIGIYEMTYAMLGVSHTDPKGTEFALEVMNRMKQAVTEWKKETGLGFALYGTPAENLCYRFAEIDKKQFGEIENVTDKGWYTNSYHVDVREPINAFEKLSFESQFQSISTGGCISYIEIPNMKKNLEALEEMVKFIYENVMYAEFNTKSDYCMKCGWDGEIEINEDNEWECPQCHNKDQNFMNVTRRTCGYLGSNFWNLGKTKEIRERVLHL